MSPVDCNEYYHAVEVYNGVDDSAPLIGQYCGDKVPPTISGGSSLYVSIRDVSTSFLATYSVLSSRT